MTLYPEGWAPARHRRSNEPGFTRAESERITSADVSAVRPCRDGNPGGSEGIRRLRLMTPAAPAALALGPAIKPNGRRCGEVWGADRGRWSVSEAGGDWYVAVSGSPRALVGLRCGSAQGEGSQGEEAQDTQEALARTNALGPPPRLTAIAFVTSPGTHRTPSAARPANSSSPAGRRAGSWPGWRTGRMAPRWPCSQRLPRAWGLGRLRCGGGRRP